MPEFLASLSTTFPDVVLIFVVVVGGLFLVLFAGAAWMEVFFGKTPLSMRLIALLALYEFKGPLFWIVVLLLFASAAPWKATAASAAQNSSPTDAPKTIPPASGSEG